MTDFLTLDDLPDVTGRAVLVRVDLNVPIHNGTISDDTRIRRIFPTLKELAQKKCKIILLSHLGRPKGTKNPQLTLAPIAESLQNTLHEHQLDINVKFCNDCIGDRVLETISQMNNGEILLCENLRFYPGEENNDANFTRKLAHNGEIYINDAFSAAHRAHASTYGLAEILPAYAGRLMEDELTALSAALDNPTPPVTAVVGGAKISTKLSVLNHLIHKTDYLILGGGMANTFLFAKGYNIGKSLHEEDMKDEALAILKAADKAECEIILPQDVVVSKEFKTDAPSQTVSVEKIGEDDMALDLGENSVNHIIEVFRNSKTILWNGPLGAFETLPFDKATKKAANSAAEMTQKGVVKTIAGGGDTVAALEQAGVAHKFTYVSTAGGAFLEAIEGRDLPGVRILKDYARRNAA